MKYILIDLIEGIDIVGTYKTKSSALNHAKDYWLDTDGECILMLTWTEYNITIEDYLFLEIDEDNNKVVIEHDIYETK